MNTIELDLIKNTYNIREAKEVLNQLLSDKITYLKQKKFSSEIRTGTCPTNVESRLVELEEARKQLREFFNKLQLSNYDVQIECPITIKLHPNNRNIINHIIEELA